MNNFPDIENITDSVNPTIYSPNNPTVLMLNQTKECFDDVELYKRFIKNAESNFRHSRTYKKIKSELITLGMDRCQINGNITNEMATIEMHHCILSLFDVALLISEHTLNTLGCINTFYLSKKLKEEHKECNVPLVMLTKTSHQLYHNTNELFILPDMIFGDWYTLLKKYKYGITKEIAYKVINYLVTIENEKDVDKNKILSIRDEILDYSRFNY